MATRVTDFSDGSYLEYARGSFDEWCVYLSRPNTERYAPRDYQYFQRLVNYASKYGKDAIYQDFVSIYNKTTKDLDNSTIQYIKDMTSKYGADALNIAIDFTIIYMGMIAEENKENAILGKRVKRLGVYQTIYDELSPDEAANFSRGKKWRELDAICRGRGF